MGERVVNPVKRWFRVQAIGVVRRPDRRDDPEAFFDPAAVSVLEVDPRWEAGLDGLEGFSHLVVMWYLDRATRRRTVGEPRAAENIAGAKLVGFFTTRTPRRPNPIGIGCPRLQRREGNRLYVTGLDAGMAARFWISKGITRVMSSGLTPRYRPG